MWYQFPGYFRGYHDDTAMIPQDTHETPRPSELPNTRRGSEYNETSEEKMDRPSKVLLDDPRLAADRRGLRVL